VTFAVYTDYVYRRADGVLYGELAFAVLLSELSRTLPLVLVGRLDPTEGPFPHRLPDDVDFVCLPAYRSLAHPRAMVAMARSLGKFWRLLDRVDGVWLFGPHPLSIAFALIAGLRRKRVVLGVRQHFPRSVAHRYTRRSWVYAAALVLEGAYRALGRVCAVVAVGAEQACVYRRARRLLPLAVSLVRERDVVPAEEALGRAYDGQRTILAVGRLEAEKNPLLLADVLASLRRRDRRWRLVVYGEGPLEPALEARLTELGVRDHAELRGYLPIEDGLVDAYRAAHVFLHVAWTEGLPQVLFEAFASGLPVVATDVGGVRGAVDGAALLVPPGDATAAVESLVRVGDDPVLRERLVLAGLALARESTVELVCARLASFLAGSDDGSAFPHRAFAGKKCGRKMRGGGHNNVVQVSLPRWGQ
jgi:glycosyltransferase involved in cell wall biosynthesis